MIPKSYEDAKPGTMPDPQAVRDGKVQRDAGEAGVLLALDGLHPPSMGARVVLLDGEPSRHRRPVRRGQRSARRLLDDRREIEAGGGRVGNALPGIRTTKSSKSARVPGMSDFPPDVQRPPAKPRLANGAVMPCAIHRPTRSLAGDGADAGICEMGNRRKTHSCAPRAERFEKISKRPQTGGVQPPSRTETRCLRRRARHAAAPPD